MLLCLSLFLLSCSEPPPTQLVILMDTDYRVPSEVDRLQARVSKLVDIGRELEQVETWREDFWLVDRSGKAETHQLPATFGIVPEEADLGREIVVELRAFAAGSGETLVSRRIKTGFVRGESRLARMPLYRACASAACAEGQSCGCPDAAACAEPSCVEEAVLPEAMERIDQPSLLPPDAEIPSGAGPELNCTDPLRICADDCANLQNDSRHCGDCETACALGEICEAGACVDPDDCRRKGTDCPGFSYCDQAVGRCLPGCAESAQCPEEGEVCDMSAHDCVCAAELERCEDSCVDTRSDPAFCGDCETICLPGDVCKRGRCVDPNDVEYNPPSEDCGVLRANEGFGAQESLLSCNGLFRLTIQSNEGLVLRAPDGILWSSGAVQSVARAAVMQADGNFVLYGPDKLPLWNSQTQGFQGAILALQDDGNLLVYARDETVVWSTDTWER